VKRSRVLTSRFRDRVVVTTKDGAAFDGILYSTDHKALVLRQASAVAAADDKSDLPLDGELILLLDDVAWIQRP
jgi:small nuclear ribonucleoprotein (snRNP)-like protein